MSKYEKRPYSLRSLAEIRFLDGLHPAAIANWCSQWPSSLYEPQGHALAYRRGLPQEVFHQSEKTPGTAQKEGLIRFRTTDILYDIDGRIS